MKPWTFEFTSDQDINLGAYGIILGVIGIVSSLITFLLGTFGKVSHTVATIGLVGVFVSYVTARAGSKLFHSGCIAADKQETEKRLRHLDIDRLNKVHASGSGIITNLEFTSYPDKKTSYIRTLYNGGTTHSKIIGGGICLNVTTGRSEPSDAETGHVSVNSSYKEVSFKEVSFKD